MAEQVNQRIEGMINELEQMKRTNLYEGDELKEIARKRKEFEYRIQRRQKEKDDFVQYIAFEMSLLEDISQRRKQAKLNEKKKDIEYAIAKRLNRVFKQFIFRFQNDVLIFFEYIKFCSSVGFEYISISAIIGQMLQIHGDKAKAWQMASKWEYKDQKNLENARNFLLKGIQRHPESEILYLDLFEIELIIAFQAETEEEKEKNLKKADIIWRNGIKNIPETNYLFKLCDLSMKYGVDDSITNSIKTEIWNRRADKNVWSYIATKELEGNHWSEIEEFIDEESNYPIELKNYIGVYEEALQQFPDVALCTKYIHGLLGINDSICTESQKISAVRRAWNYGHENGLLTNKMYAFGIRMLKLDDMPAHEYTEVLETALAKNPHCMLLWEEKLMLHSSEEQKMLLVLTDAGKCLKSDDMIALWDFMFDNIDSNVIFKNCYSKFQTCENVIILNLKPKLLKKMYEHNGLKAARQVYDDFIRTPPMQIDLHKVMIDIEMSQEKPAVKYVRKCYEVLIQHHGKDNIEIWLDYINFEQNTGSPQAVPAIHRRAIAMLDQSLVDSFIKAQMLAKLK